MWRFYNGGSCCRETYDTKNDAKQGVGDICRVGLRMLHYTISRLPLKPVPPPSLTIASDAGAAEAVTAVSATVFFAKGGVNGSSCWFRGILL